MNTPQPSPPEPTWPRLRLDFYETDIIMTQWETPDRLKSYPVAVDDMVAACSQVTLGSGWLPPDTLFWKKQANHEELAIYIPAKRWHIPTARHTYHLPLPPLVFHGRQYSYQVFAVKKRPTLHTAAATRHPQTHLFHFPGPNVHLTGTICRGDTPFPPCAPHTILAAITRFLEGSLFNKDLHQNKCRTYPEDILQLWQQLDGRKRFPLSELVPANVSLNQLYE